MGHRHHMAGTQQLLSPSHTVPRQLSMKPRFRAVFPAIRIHQSGSDPCSACQWRPGSLPGAEAWRIQAPEGSRNSQRPFAHYMSDSPGRSLHDLEGDEHADVGTGSVLATTCRVHRRTPIEQLGTEALRFLLEEGQSTDVLLRVAIDRLERYPFQGGDFYPGDLLVTVLGLPGSTWISAPDLRAQVYALVEDAGDLVDLLEPEDRSIVEQAIGRFKSRWLHGGVGMGQ